MPRQMKVALGQIRPALGAIQENVDKHVEWTNQAKAAGANLIVFPELGLTGYQVQDMTLDVSRPLSHPDIQKVVAESHGIDVVFSFIEESPEHLFYVSAVYAANGQIRHVHRKSFLPTYAMFDEGRYFAPGQEFRVFQGCAGNTGIMICEDAWHTSSPYLLGIGGATLLIVPASSPTRSVTDEDSFGSQKFWRQLNQVYGSLFGAHIIFVNRVGFEDGVSFFGASSIVGPDGCVIVEAGVLEEQLVISTCDLTAVRRARFTTPIVRDERPDMVVRETMRILREKGRGPTNDD